MITAYAAAQSGLVVAGDGSVGEKVAGVAAELTMAGGATMALGVARMMEDLGSPSYVRAFLAAGGSLASLGLTAAQLHEDGLCA
jgi:hypothetical protein